MHTFVLYCYPDTMYKSWDNDCFPGSNNTRKCWKTWKNHGKKKSHGYLCSQYTFLYFWSEKYYLIFFNPFPVISSNWKSHGKSLVRKFGVAVFEVRLDAFAVWGRAECSMLLKIWLIWTLLLLLCLLNSKTELVCWYFSQISLQHMPISNLACDLSVQFKKGTQTSLHSLSHKVSHSPDHLMTLHPRHH